MSTLLASCLKVANKCCWSACHEAGEAFTEGQHLHLGAVRRVGVAAYGFLKSYTIVLHGRHKDSGKGA